MALQALAVDLTGPAVVTAELTGKQRRVTSQSVEVLASGVKRRFSQLTVKVLRASPEYLETSITSSALLVGNLTLGLEPLEVDIIGSALISAELLNPNLLETNIVCSAAVTAGLTENTSLYVDITGSALIGANLKLPPLKANITGSVLIVPDLSTSVTLFIPWGGIECSATITALLDKNLQHVSSTITFTQEVTALNEHVGNSLQLQQTLEVELISNSTAENTLEFTQSATIEGIYYESLETELDTLEQLVVVSLALPTETASNTITFTQAVSVSRPVENTLNLTQSAVGVIGGIYEDTSSTLNLTQDLELDTVLNISLTSLLQLQHEAFLDLVTNQTANSSLNLGQVVYNINLVGGSIASCVGAYGKQYVYLQVPAATVVLPAPIWGDTENITDEMILHRSMNGITRTYVKTNINRRLTYTFRLLGRAKAIELLEFLRLYDSDIMTLTNWKGEVWRVNLLNNPSDFVQTRRSGTDISLEFEGEKLYG